MNYQKIIDIFGGLAKRTGMMNLANLEWGLSSEELPSDIKTDGDPAEAAKLLGAAGYDADNHLQVKTSVAQYYSGPAVGQITQALLKPLNIDVDIEIQELGDWIANVYRAGSPYQMTTHADWTWEDPDRGLFSYFHSQGSQNNTHYNNPDVDRMLEEQRAEFDLETRQQIVKDIQLQVINDTPQAWLVAPGGLNFVRNRIKNLRRMIHGNSNFYRQWSTVWFGDPSSAG
jgi:ABC-type transport system substrate-binding protein